MTKTILLALTMMLICSHAHADTQQTTEYWSHELKVDMDCWSIRGTGGPEDNWCKQRLAAKARHEQELYDAKAKEDRVKALAEVNKDMAQ